MALGKFLHTFTHKIDLKRTHSCKGGLGRLSRLKFYLFVSRYHIHRGCHAPDLRGIAEVQSADEVNTARFHLFVDISGSSKM